MLQFALLFLLPQTGGEAPSVRAGDGLFYIEAPDVPALLEAYPSAPLLQMVGDESVRAVVGALIEESGLNVAGSVARALREAGLPEAMAAMPLESLAGTLELIQSASLSVMLSGETSEVCSELTNSLEALARIQKLEELAEKHKEGNQGFPPDELFELDVPEDWLTDPWGQPYLIEVDLETLEHEIVCLGSDGVEGGAGFAADLRSGEPEREQITRLVSSTLDVVARLDFTTDESAKAAWGQAASLLEGQMGQRADGLEEVKIRGVSAHIREFPELMGEGSGVWMLQQERGISMGLGRRALARAVARLQTEGSSATASERVGEVAGYLSKSRGATVTRGWAELDRMAALLEAVASADLAEDQLTVNMFPFRGGAAFRTQLDGRRFVSEVAYSVSPTSPMARCAGATPVPASLWEFVPAEAIGVYASSIDGQAVYEEILRSLGAAPGQRPKALERLEAMHGFSLDQDVIGSLGGGMAVYLLPIGGVLSVPGLAVVVELSDAEAFQRGIDGALTLLEEKAGGEFSVRYKPYRDQPLWTFGFGGGGGFAGPQISPTLAIVKDHLLVTLTSTRAKKEIKRLLSDELGARHRVFDMQGGPPADAGSVGFMDWPGLADGTYEGARAALTMFAGMLDDLPVDPEMLPEASTFTKFFEPSVYWTRPAAPGVWLSHSESSFGPETVLAIAGGIGALGLSIKDMQGTRRVEVVEIEEVGPDVEALTEQTLETLDMVATRLEVYRIENSAYPGSLMDLLRPSSNYPRGYLGREDLPTDAWGRSLVYVPGADRASRSLWSVGANGKDERGEGDDVRLP